MTKEMAKVATRKKAIVGLRPSLFGAFRDEITTIGMPPSAAAGRKGATKEPS
jgi:hypothetical protein